MVDQLRTVYIDAFIAGALFTLSHCALPFIIRRFSLSLYLVTGYPLDIDRIVYLIHFLKIFEVYQHHRSLSLLAPNGNYGQTT